MLPRSAVIYSYARKPRNVQDYAHANLACGYVAQAAGLDVVECIVESDHRTNSDLQTFLKKTWNPDLTDEVIFPYTLIIPNRKMATRNLRSLILNQIIGLIVADEAQWLFDIPSKLNFPVCPSLTEPTPSPFMRNGKMSICPHLQPNYGGGSLEPICRFENVSDALCPGRPDFDSKYAEYLGEQERRKRAAYRRLNLHFLEIRAHFQHRAKAERPETIRHKWAVWKKMCEILECEKVWLADATVGKILADYGYYPSGINKSPELGERVIYNEQSIGDLLVDIGKLDEWHRRKDGYGPRTCTPRDG